MACVALNIPSAIRLIRLFNMLFSLLRVDTRCAVQLKRRYRALFSPENKKARPRKFAAGLLLFCESWLLATGVGANPICAVNDVSIS
jgi:hypothetical protein